MFQILTELFVSVVFRLQALGTFFRILGSRQRPLSPDDGDVADNSQAVVWQPLGGGGSALQDVGVDKFSKSPGIRFCFELRKGGLDPVLFVLGGVEDGELVPGLDLGLGLVGEVD